jgi:hypothetical protein
MCSSGLIEFPALAVYYYLLYAGVALHVSTFARLSSAELQEYKTVLELSLCLIMF